MHGKNLKRRDLLKSAVLITPAAAGLTGAARAETETAKNRHGDRMIERYPVFDDARSKKVMFVAHCVLNQNARIEKCAYTPSAIPKIAACLMERGIGIIQLPCPELGYLGLGRGGGVEIYDQLSAPGARRALRAMAADIVYQVKQYQKQGFRVLGVLGLDGSPSCGVDLTWYEKEGPGRGAFMEEVIQALKSEGLEVPVHGVQDAEPGKALELIRQLDPV